MTKRTVSRHIDEELNEQMVTWLSLREAKNRKRVLYAKAVGLEEISLGDLRMECLKLNYEGVYGYLPRNKIDDYEFKGLHNFMGKTFEFVVETLITEPDEQVGTFVANRIEALKLSANRFWNNAQVGEIYEAFIRGIDPYHLYILVEGVQVKLHRSEVGYSLYDDLREVYSIGDSIEVKILELGKPNEENSEGTLQVSAKILNQDPWDNIGNYKERMFYLAELKRIHPVHGMFLELEPGLSVLTYFPAGTRGRKFKPGDELEVKIKTIDVEKREIFGTIVLPRNKIGANNPSFRNSGIRRGNRG
ncbi:S1 RNA-binding domain-containing protein [Paenibacillus glucanolyticus]|jgi:small subunit ribosomal protein S1|uniref:S1 motif domain-containing protein n=1 Tax=Paenibacillus glucanolyticus TaxID=59843 RepID=A0A163GI06_9BACL|nr:S1 RNA-binding domain-containing protein [Paenibacillus glucanolyticus]KZS44982.1 hypothetical protein AWU65_03100 [Paenibacillus glucanolyticus]OMF64805.1 hypothetical protein BK142_31410 [Paenibacillus glucanolyticus]